MKTKIRKAIRYITGRLFRIMFKEQRQAAAEAHEENKALRLENLELRVRLEAQNDQMRSIASNRTVRKRAISQIREEIAKAQSAWPAE